MSTVAENCWVMQIKRDQLITHNIKKCQMIFFSLQIKGNDSQWLETTFKCLVQYPLGKYCLRCTLTACRHDTFMLQLTSRFDISARFPGVKTFCFFFKKTKAFARCSTEILVFAPWSIMPVAAFSVDHVCPFKYRTRHSEIEQKFRFTTRVEKN